MTTIAYKDGVIAWDSRLSRGGTILTDNYNKRYKVKDGWAVFSGDTSTIKEYVSEYPSPPKCGGEFNGMVVKENELRSVAFVDGILYFEIWDGSIPVAYGSGQDHAFTAMDMGATAKEAVKMAMKRDKATGGRIRSMKV